MIKIQFEVIGLPAPQGSKSAVVIGGKARIIEGKTSGQRAKHTSWRDSVATAARAIAELDADTPLRGPLRLDVLLRMPRPASRPKRHHGWHAVTPDKDKILRSIGDALQMSGLVANDSLFAAGSWEAIEVVGWTGAVLTVSQLAPITEVVA